MYTIYTDGSSLGNPGPGGYAAILFEEYNQDGNTVSREVARLFQGYRMTTNNRMEIMAAIRALDLVPVGEEVALHTDSQLLVHAFEKDWVRRWQSKGWKKSGYRPVKNRDLWEQLLKRVEDRTVRFQWVRGHDGNAFNELCDSLSRTAARGDNLPEDRGYTPR